MIAQAVDYRYIGSGLVFQTGTASDGHYAIILDRLYPLGTLRFPAGWQLLP